MRLICPNCGAQYEVPDEVVPENGRDVQCSNCGHTWFQAHPDHDRELAEDLDLPVPDEDWSPEDDIEPEAVYSEPEPEPEPKPAEPPAPQRRELPNAVADVLREEAAAEQAAREAERGHLESQPDLGLDRLDENDEERRAREGRERLARIKGEPDPIAAPVNEPEMAAMAGSRRDLLPDIDEIKSTLESGSDRGASTATQRDAPRERRRGFRRGFVLMVLLAVIAVAVYLQAPAISEQVPQAKPYLDDYVAQVDAGRVWLDGQVSALLAWLDSMASSAAGESAPADG